MNTNNNKYASPACRCLAGPSRPIFVCSSISKEDKARLLFLRGGCPAQPSPAQPSPIKKNKKNYPATHRASPETTTNPKHNLNRKKKTFEKEKEGKQKTSELLRRPSASHVDTQHRKRRERDRRTRWTERKEEEGEEDEANDVGKQNKKRSRCFSHGRRTIRVGPVAFLFSPRLWLPHGSSASVRFEFRPRAEGYWPGQSLSFGRRANPIARYRASMSGGYLKIAA